MTATVSFSCPNCSQSIRVEMRQAGQAVTCRACRQVVEVPTMRTLRSLVPVEEAPATSRPAAARGTPLRRILFAVGTAVFLLFAAAGGAMFYWASQLVVEIPQERLAEINRETFAEIESADMNRLWEIWMDDVLARPPAIWTPSVFVQNQRTATFRRTIGLVLFGVAAVGVATMIASTVVRR